MASELVSALGRPTRQNKTPSPSSSLLIWSQLPEELLHVISEKLNNCFEAIHIRSVCSPWRSSFPFSSHLIRPSYPLPTYPIEKEGLCNLEKVPLFLFRDRATSVYFVGGVLKDDPIDYIERPSPLQCSVKIVTSDPRVRNMLDFKIIPLGHCHRLVCWDPNGRRFSKTMVACLPLRREDGEEFVVLHCHSKTLLVLTSAEKKWFPLANVPSHICTGLVAFRGKFYATFANMDVFVIDPYSLEATLLVPTLRLKAVSYVVQSGDDELFLVEKSNPSVKPIVFRVSKLDEEAGRWVEVSDLGGRVLLFGRRGSHVCFLAKELPDGCGVTENSILFTNEPQPRRKAQYKPPYFYKYELDCWKLSKENVVTILNTCPMLSFRVEC